MTFAGLVDNAMVARYCAAADLFVLPSLLEALPDGRRRSARLRDAGDLRRQSGRTRAQRRVRQRCARSSREDALALAAAIRAKLRT